MRFRCADTSQREVALTFDDGPDETFTPQVLEILHHYGVHATFFCIGSQIQKYPDVLRNIAEGGHTIANHSWSHPHLTTMAAHDVMWELAATSGLIEEVVGCRPLFMRPPYGDLDARVEALIESEDYHVILWDVDSVDWSGIAGPQVAAHVLPDLHPGAIVLHHSAGRVAGTVAALPYLIEVTQAMGYRYARLADMLGIPAYK